ncbi:hypothetical protein SAMN05216378_4953 [Paenibacillus catalpae]|uniref:Uncharacterized protein n=1 Tax=Paenibacillus catalpae TaxID=1045775 RepID=A0A1I2FQK5_9BACL|nr:hypothetical protein SAMN05216378_4953 [Paenibacillus catalpae]
MMQGQTSRTPAEKDGFLTEIHCYLDGIYSPLSYNEGVNYQYLSFIGRKEGGCFIGFCKRIHNFLRQEERVNDNAY